MTATTTHGQQQQQLWEGMNPEDPLVRTFRQFHQANPHVYTKLRELALQLKRKGRERYSIVWLFEVVRWHTAINTTDQDYKLNNNLRPWYARLLMHREPELVDFFRTRSSVADRMEGSS